MSRNPTPDVSSNYGAPMGRGWPHIAIFADTIVKMYETTPPRTDEERRHLQVARAALYKASSPEAQFAGRVSLQRVRLDNGGYDAGGAYWGLGAPLYCAASECGTVDL